MRRRLVHADPHVALAVAAAVVVALEYGYRTWTSDAWLLLEAAVAGAGLLYAWREQHRLRLTPLLAVAAGFHVAWIALHLGLGVTGDVDTSRVFRWQGNALLHGYYPRSEYPVGAVLLFTLEAWVGGGATKAANAVLMIPVQLACVVAIWSVRTRWAPWLAALVAFWPLNAYYWEFKFDLVPAALLAAGLVLALRERWALSGLMLGLGAVVKWMPGLAFVGLIVWLAACGRRTALVRHASAFVATVVLVHIPFVLWDASAVARAYTRQGGRSITPESIWYLMLRPLGLAHLVKHVSFSAGAAAWANAAAVVAQLLALIVLLVLLSRARDVRAAVALAAMLPVAFLLANRIFSPQFILVLFVCWVVAGALLLDDRGRQLAFGVALAVASAGNAFVYPYAPPFYPYTWPAASAVFFTVAVAITAWIAVNAQRARASP